MNKHEYDHLVPQGWDDHEPPTEKPHNFDSWADLLDDVEIQKEEYNEDEYE